MILSSRSKPVFQVVEGQPHLLAFTGKRRRPVTLRLTLTAESHETALHAYSVINGQTSITPVTKTEAIVRDDHKSPLYVVFKNLTGIHAFQVQSVFKDETGKVHSKMVKLLVQASRLDLHHHYEELIDRFRFKMVNNITPQLLCPVTSELEDDNTVHERILHHCTFLTKNLRSFSGKKMIESPTFLNKIYKPPRKGESNLLATALYLIDRFGATDDDLRIINDFIEYYRDNGLGSMMQPLSAVREYIKFYSDDLARKEREKAAAKMTAKAKQATQLTPDQLDLYPDISSLTVACNKPFAPMSSSQLPPSVWGIDRSVKCQDKD